MCPTTREYQHHGGGIGHEHIEGISVRAHFAGQALQGMMANGFMPNQAIHTHARYLAQKDKDYNYAAAAVEMADALIAELAKETTSTP